MLSPYGVKISILSYREAEATVGGAGRQNWLVSVSEKKY
jgi:hypothetical protein